MDYKLEQNDVHIWRAHLDWPKDKFDAAFQLLSEEEQARAERFVIEQHRDRYIASHAVLHQILSLYVNCPPEKLQFQQNDHGKPYIANLPLGLNLQFNMSDSHDYALYGLRLDDEVGVDLEYMKSKIRAEEIAKRFFSPDEYRALLDLPPSERLEGFYRCWSRKEAYIKAIGQGLSFNLSRFSVSLKPDGLNCLLEVDGSAELARQWRLGSVSAPEHFQAALAVEGEVRKIKNFDWSKS